MHFALWFLREGSHQGPFKAKLQRCMNRSISVFWQKRYKQKSATFLWPIGLHFAVEMHLLPWLLSSTALMAWSLFLHALKSFQDSMDQSLFFEESVLWKHWVPCVNIMQKKCNLSHADFLLSPSNFLYVPFSFNIFYLKMYSSLFQPSKTLEILVCFSSTHLILSHLGI